MSVVKKIGDYLRLPDVMERFPLGALKAANYIMRVTLLSPQGNPLDVKEDFFYISPMLVLPRPWVLSVPLYSATAPQYWNDLGNQYFNLKDFPQARKLLEKAYHLSPQTASFAMDYCRVLMEMKDYQQAKNIALLLFKNQDKKEFIPILAQASRALNQNNDAIDYFKQHIAHFGASPKILNALGECYIAMSNGSEALKAWEKSLEIDPKQEKLKERVAALKRGKK
jgi:tetratricopeptide (TPR) repeat protein